MGAIFFIFIFDFFQNFLESYKTISTIILLIFSFPSFIFAYLYVGQVILPDTNYLKILNNKIPINLILTIITSIIIHILWIVLLPKKEIRIFLILILIFFF
jgi:hypothetical protein